MLPPKPDGTDSAPTSLRALLANSAASRNEFHVFHVAALMFTASPW